MELKYFVYFFNMLALCIGSANIGVTIIYRAKRNVRWVNYYLSFLIFLTLLMCLNFIRFFYSFVGPESYTLYNNVLTMFFLVNLSFLIYFIPYFTTWLIDHKWRQPYKTIFLILALLYLLISVYYTFFPDHNKAIDLAIVAIFSGTIGFGIAILLKNRGSITEPGLKNFTSVYIFLSILFCPIFILDAFFGGFIQNWVGIPPGAISLPLYYFWFSLFMLIFMFDYFLNTTAKTAGELKDEHFKTYKITDREKEIILLMEKGLTYKEIGEKLFISANTVNNHAAKIYSKIGAKNRIGLLKALSE